MESELDIYFLTEQRHELESRIVDHFTLKSIFDFNFDLEAIPNWSSLEKHITDWHMWAGDLLMNQNQCFTELRVALETRAVTEGIPVHLNSRFTWSCSSMNGSLYFNTKKMMNLHVLLTTSSEAVKGLPEHVSLSTRLALFKALVRKAYKARFRDTMPRVLVKGLPAIMCGKDA
jgi:hypothetical protein